MHPYQTPLSPAETHRLQSTSVARLGRRAVCLPITSHAARDTGPTLFPYAR